MKSEQLKKSLETVQANQPTQNSTRGVTFGDLRHWMLELQDMERKEAEQKEENHKRALNDAMGEHGQR